MMRICRKAQSKVKVEKEQILKMYGTCLWHIIIMKAHL